MQRYQRMLSVASGFAGAAWLLVTPALAAQPAAEAPASSVSLAERYAEEGYQAYVRQDYRSAVALYLQALDAAPSADIVYNLARVYDLGLHDRPLAIRFYARYVDDPAAVPSRRDTSRQRLAELRAAEPAAPRNEPAAPGAPPRPIDEERGGSATPVLAVAAGALGLVGVGMGVGFGVAAKSDLDVARRYCEGSACTTLRGVRAAQSAARAADVATIGFAAGGTLLALGTVLWLVADDEAESARPPGRLRWTPSISPEEVSLGLSGSFAGL